MAQYGCGESSVTDNDSVGNGATGQFTVHGLRFLQRKGTDLGFFRFSFIYNKRMKRDRTDDLYIK